LPQGVFESKVPVLKKSNTLIMQEKITRGFGKKLS
jgi:hypothetical protein